MTDTYAVIGHPIEHSRSPDIHALFAAQTGQDMRYGRRSAPVDGFAASIRAFFAAGGAGLNVTLPFKQEAFERADTLSERAQRASAVNTLMARGDEIHGDNTDGAGLVADLVARLGTDLAGAHVLILGAGGAVRGVVPNLFAASVGRITIANRTPAKSQAIAESCRSMGSIAACGLAEAPFDGDLVINAISAGLAGEMPALDDRVLTRARAVYDMIYADTATPFLRWARDHGVAGEDGLGMLVEQAAESFALWRGIRPDTQAVITALRSPQALQ